MKKKFCPKQSDWEYEKEILPKGERLSKYEEEILPKGERLWEYEEDLKCTIVFVTLAGIDKQQTLIADELE